MPMVQRNTLRKSSTSSAPSQVGGRGVGASGSVVGMEMRLTEVSVRLAIKMDPQDADAHSNLGLILFNDGKTRLSMDSLRTAVKIDKDHVVAHNNLGVALTSDNQVGCRKPTTSCP